jgi:hypothetical protein
MLKRLKVAANSRIQKTNKDGCALSAAIFIYLDYLVSLNYSPGTIPVIFCEFLWQDHPAGFFYLAEGLARALSSVLNDQTKSPGFVV